MKKDTKEDASKAWTTSIAFSSPEKTIVRGYKLEELIDKLSFHEMIFLVLTGRLPSKGEAAVVNAIFVSCAEHGISPPSITSARIIASGGSPFQAAVAGGVLALGEHHGGAIEAAAKIFQERSREDPAAVVNEMVGKKQRFPGYGHKIYATDPRTIKLLDIAQQHGIAGTHVSFAIAVEKELERAKGQKLCLNVDGAIAALLGDMGIGWRLGKAFFIIPRTVGICAHVYEELAKEKPFRRLDAEETGYSGKDGLHLS
ncbi:citryl-CoA lyase [Candidatus Woesearchaeota archaeon]|nr:citryl-CoA lyase [Candidatus Woesearchaeota archaeon]